MCVCVCLCVMSQKQEKNVFLTTENTPHATFKHPQKSHKKDVSLCLFVANNQYDSLWEIYVGIDDFKYK